MDLKTLQERLATFEKELETSIARRKQNYLMFYEDVTQKLIDIVGVEVRQKVRSTIFNRISSPVEAIFSNI